MQSVSEILQLLHHLIHKVVFKEATLLTTDYFKQDITYLSKVSIALNVYILICELNFISEIL